ncbi:MAG: HlyD family efflux transporter periplasmic adaptor subunit [Bacteroidales bacterium]|nr:HlyD family efflux transporter periplasmic adaptor subunit [Bacteroidales bacterium]
MRNLIFIFIALAFSSCNNNQQLSDAFGNFEAVTVSVSSETAGRILQLDVEEGQALSNGQQIGVIDTTDLYLKKLQLMAQRNAIATRMSGVQGQIDVQLQQKANLLVEKERISKLLKDKAATPKQLDDITGAIELVEKQISSIKTQNSGILEEQVVIDRQIDIVKESIRKCYIRNPVEGTVLVKYAESGEVTTPGKTLYKIANLETMELKVYVSGNQLPSVKLGQKVEVLIDKDSKSNRKLEGIVSWISQKAEFTPKIIQTKEERVDLVYGIKVRVKNDGSLKISMPGEVNFNK